MEKCNGAIIILMVCCVISGKTSPCITRPLQPKVDLPKLLKFLTFEYKKLQFNIIFTSVSKKNMNYNDTYYSMFLFKN